MSEEVATCVIDSGLRNLVSYSHIVTPLLLIYFLVGLWQYRDRATPPSTLRHFTIFVVLFLVWLLGNYLTWVLLSPHWISFAWSLLDLTNTLFYAAGTWLVISIVAQPISRSWHGTLPLLALAAPAFWLTGIGQSVTGFDQAACEAYGHEWLASYKLVAEIVYTLVTALAVGWGLSRAKAADRRAEIFLVGLPVFAFFLIFGLTEYYSSTTGIYEVSLYALFTVPILFIPVVYALLRYQMSRFATIGIRLLALVTVALIGAQFFFIRNQTNYIINSVTFVLVAIFAVMIVRSVRREAFLRERAESLAKNLEAANLRLLELDKQKSEFVSLASHQLRGPLTAIKGYASMLNEGDYGQIPISAMEILGRIGKSAHDMAILITDYLDVTRIELGKVKYQPERFSLRDLLTEVEKELMPNVPKEKVTLSIDEGADPRFVFADRNKVKQVVMNLIDNAVKYTPEGAVTVALVRREGYARLEVKDSGVGITRESLPHLFQKFSRAKNASKMNIRGTGLGLYIAKTIADYHRGHLTAQSEGEGKGSTFIFELPLADEQAPSDRTKAQ